MGYDGYMSLCKYLLNNYDKVIVVSNSNIYRNVVINYNELSYINDML